MDLGLLPTSYWAFPMLDLFLSDYLRVPLMWTWWKPSRGSYNLKKRKLKKSQSLLKELFSNHRHLHSIFSSKSFLAAVCLIVMYLFTFYFLTSLFIYLFTYILISWKTSSQFLSVKNLNIDIHLYLEIALFWFKRLLRGSRPLKKWVVLSLDVWNSEGLSHRPVTVHSRAIQDQGN